MNNQTRQYCTERQFSIAELLWHLCEQWKAMVCFTLIIMALFLVLLHARYQNQDSANVREQGKQQAYSPDELINGLPKEAQNDVAYAYQLKKQLIQFKETTHESPWMKLNPYHVKRLYSSWTVLNDTVNGSALAESYILYLKSDKICQKLLPCYGEKFDINQVRESILVDCADEDVAGAFRCEFLIYADTDEEMLKKAVSSAMDDAHTLISKHIGEHQTRCFDEGIIEGSCELLGERQEAVVRRASYINQQLETTIGKLSQEQKSTYEQMSTLLDGQGSTQKLHSKAITLRNVLLGIVLGIIGYIALLFVYMIMSGKVHSCCELENSVGYTLGEWYGDRSREGLLFLFRDRFVYRRHHKKHIDQSSEIQQTEKAILNACRDDKKQLLFACDVALSADQKTFSMNLQESLSQSGISVKEQYAYDGENLFDKYSISDIDGVVIYLIEGKTKYKHIDKIMTQCSYYDVPVLGQIYLG